MSNNIRMIQIYADKNKPDRETITIIIYNNYMSTLCKILVIFITNKIYYQIEGNSILAEEQKGYRRSY